MRRLLYAFCATFNVGQMIHHDGFLYWLAAVGLIASLVTLEGG